MLTKPDAIEVAKERLYEPLRLERERLDRVDRWYRWSQDDIQLPRKATPELRALAGLSKTPWLGLVVTTVAQAMYVDGYRSGLDSGESSDIPVGPWRTWQANDFDRRQVAVHRAALAYGYSFVTVLPGASDDGDRTSVLRGVSPRKMHAVYADPAEDDWPLYALRLDINSDKSALARLYDDECEYYLSVDAQGEWEFVEWRRHGAGVCPVVRYANMLDLDGRSPGEVEPFIPAASRINKTAFDRLVTQHFSSWKVRTVSGMAQPDTEEAQNRMALGLRQEDLLVAEDPDTRFGTLDATELGGFIDAWRADIEGLAAVSQTPTHALTGQLVNLNADALAASRAGLTQKVFERQKSFGGSHRQTLRLAAALEGDADYAADVSGRVTWQDMEIRSLSQAVDALGKAAQMLGVPQQALWGRIPGVEKSDVDEWVRLAERADPVARMTERLERQAAGEA